MEEAKLILPVLLCRCAAGTPEHHFPAHTLSSKASVRCPSTAMTQRHLSLPGSAGGRTRAREKMLHALVQTSENKRRELRSEGKTLCRERTTSVGTQRPSSLTWKDKQCVQPVLKLGRGTIVV